MRELNRKNWTRKEDYKMMKLQERLTKVLDTFKAAVVSFHLKQMEPGKKNIVQTADETISSTTVEKKILSLSRVELFWENAAIFPV